jgi:hypothetical protein
VIAEVVAFLKPARKARNPPQVAHLNPVTVRQNPENITQASNVAAIQLPTAKSQCLLTDRTCGVRGTVACKVTSPRVPRAIGAPRELTFTYNRDSVRKFALVRRQALPSPRRTGDRGLLEKPSPRPCIGD